MTARTYLSRRSISWPCLPVNLPISEASASPTSVDSRSGVNAGTNGAGLKTSYLPSMMSRTRSAAWNVVTARV
ncbi:hypothetical protein G6F40_018063 [Rhizopus arrhizus]|nr:hypothetical protein G6F31_020976 [Rhizopus arrhizus]KAG1060485.1 hypothetical protein G6F40_018063 [Rhizopus arrhizus]KAG1240813.1 hypothetical protein G6F68_017296 [Rhizopus microsporus]